MKQCQDRSVCPANALPGSDFCAEHSGKPSKAETRAAVFEGLGRLHRSHDYAAATVPNTSSVVPFSFVREALLPFQFGGERGLPNHTLVAEPTRPFMPRGLMLWNVGELEVEASFVGQDMQLVCGWGKVPAKWWSTQRSFEDVVQALERGEQAAAWGHWSSAWPGYQVRLMFDGPAAHVRALMWGLTE